METTKPDHPITIHQHPGRVIVRLGEQVIADTRKALALHEASYRAVLYIPRADANMALLERTTLTTYCPYKGNANYFSIPDGGDRSVNAVWTYETPFPLVAPIKDHLAFYSDRVDEITQQA